MTSITNLETLPANTSRADAITHYLNAMKDDPSCIQRASELLWRGGRLQIGFDGKFYAGRSIYTIDDRAAFLVAHDAAFVEGIENISRVASNVLRFANFVRND